MKFRSATFNNFRLLRNVHIDFSVDSEKPLTVIRAENETGKTTILNALQWALFGESGLPTNGVSYRIIPIDWDTSSLAKPAEITAELEFEHTFERQNDDGTWFETKEVYLASRRATEKLEGVDRWNRYDESFQLFHITDNGYLPLKGGELVIRQIMGSNLKDLFFTDSDRALSFITSEVSAGEKRKKVQTAIRDMLGFELLENASYHVKKGLSDIRGQVKEFAGNEEITQVEQRVQSLSEKEDQNNSRLAELDDNINNIESDIEDLDQKIERALEKGNKEELVKEKQGKSEVLSKTRIRLEAIKKQHGQLFQSEELSQLLIKGYLVKSDGMLAELKKKGVIPRTAIPILKERLEIGECICGESLQPGSSRFSHIQKLISDQESNSEVDDRLTELRIIASQKVIQVDKVDGGWLEQIRHLIENRTYIEKQIEIVEKDIKALEKKIDMLPDADVGFLRAQRKERIGIKDTLIKEQGIRIGDKERIARIRRDAEDKLAKLLSQQSKYLKVRCRIEAASDILNVLVTSYKAIEDEEIPQVSKSMNDMFLEMIQSDPETSIICKTEISPSYDITVVGPMGRRLDTDLDLNGASRRALTMAFLLALTEVSGVVAPNIIDTPLGMTSGIVKRAILETAVKHATQLVLFLTRDEISGCQELIDQYAGKTFTLTNSAHYPKQLVNNPDGTYKRMIRCECNQYQYCNVCERIGDRNGLHLTKRG